MTTWICCKCRCALALKLLVSFAGLTFTLNSPKAFASSLIELGMMGRPQIGNHSLSIEGTRHNQNRVEYGQARATATLYKKDQHTLKFNAKYAHINITPNNSNITDLYDSDFGLAYSYTKSETQFLSFSANYGSNSDHMYKASDVNTLSLNSIYSFSKNPKSRWTLVLNYSNNRPFLNNIPLPFFTYTYIFSPDLIGTFGAPFASVFWRFSPKWSLNLLTIVPWVLKAQVSYQVWGPMQAYSGVDVSQQSFFELGRSNHKERIFFEESRVFVGLKSPLSKNIFAEAELGQSFNRKLFSAEDYTWNPDERTRLDSSLYGRLRISLFL